MTLPRAHASPPPHCQHLGPPAAGRPQACRTRGPCHRSLRAVRSSASAAATRGPSDDQPLLDGQVRSASPAVCVGWPESLRRRVASSFPPLALALLLSAANAGPLLAASTLTSGETFENVPQDLSGGDAPRRIQHPKSAKAENCTRKCVGTCIRGGAGAPGEGPLNVRRPLVVFKEGFRSRQYCLVECSEICNLLGERDDGP